MRSSPFVELVVRSDAPAKGGGDLIQAEQYVAGLRELGVEARIIPFSPSWRPDRDAIVHYLNADRYFELLIVAARARAARGLVVSSIHHPAAAVRALRRAQRGLSPAGLVARLPEGLREYIAFARRSLLSRDPRALRTVLHALPLLPALRSHIARVLEAADTITLLTDDEGRALRRDFRWSGGNGVLIPNGVPETSAGAVLPTREEILVIGRIEPRKRQLELARLAAESGTRVGFIGAANENSGAYVQRFRSLVADTEAVSWYGPLGHADTVAAMREAGVVLSFGWAEVQSLVEIEAVRAGCWVVHNADTGDRAWLGDAAVGLPGGDPRRALDRCAELAGGPPPSGPGYTRTWAEAAHALAQVYAAAAGAAADPRPESA